MSSTHGTPRRRRRTPVDMDGIRQRGDRYQVRIFAGWDLVTGKRIELTGSAGDPDAALDLRDPLQPGDSGQQGITNQLDRRVPS